MPDFLHKDSASAPTAPERPTPQQSPGAASVVPVAAPAGAPSRTPWSGNAGVTRRSGHTDETSSEMGQPRKRPSRLFTDYYAPLFLLLVTVALFVGFVLLRPLVMEYRKSQGTIANTAMLLKDEQGYLDSLRQSILAAQTIAPQTLQDVEEALPQQPDVPKLLVMMSTLAQVNNVDLSSVQFTVSRAAAQEGDALGGLETVDIGINVASLGYAGTRRYLDALERNLRLLDVGVISLQPSGAAGSADGRWSYGLQLRAYSLPQPSSTP